MTRRFCLAAVMTFIYLGTAPAWGEQYYRYEPQTVAPDDKAGGNGVLVKEISIQKGDTLYDLSHKYSGKGYFYPQILLFNDIKNPNKIYTGDMIRVPVSKNEATNSYTSQSTKNDTTSKQVASKKMRKKATKPAGINKNTPAELSLSDLQQLDATATQKKISKLKTSHKKYNGKTKITKAKDTLAAKTIEPAPVLTQQESLPVVQPQFSSETSIVTNSTDSQKSFAQALNAYQQENFTKALELFDRFISENPNSPLAADANLYKAECYLKQSGL